MRFRRNRRTCTLRVIAGQFRSRPLRSLPGLDIRPTADRLRETLFNVLTAGNPSALEGAVWADLFAGTGAVGIEALSRGAGKVFFVESACPAIKVIQGNLNALEITAGFDLVHGEVGKTLRRWQLQHMLLDYVFLDPPYRQEHEYRDILEFLGESSLLKASTIVVAEHTKKFEPIVTAGVLRKSRTLVQGDAALSFYRKE